jgi:hypothetical protein
MNTTSQSNDRNHMRRVFSSVIRLAFTAFKIQLPRWLLLPLIWDTIQLISTFR